MNRAMHFDDWLRSHDGDLKIDDARGGFDAGWAAARTQDRAWFRRTIESIRATAREGRQTGRWAFPLDRITNWCDQTLHLLDVEEAQEKGQ